MSKPPLFPQKTASGIAIDPRTLDRVVPESRRADGTVRKERKIRPGFTPQEDVARFRSTRQQAVETRTLPKGHIPGWAPPGAVASETPTKEPQSKSAKKNEKRKEKRKEKRQEAVQENWDSDADEDATANPVDKEARTTQVADSTPQGQPAQDEESTGPKVDTAESGVDTIVDKLDKLAV